ncbi:MAG: hypothetical protein HFI59_10850 [Lachnospiraceae bacterium]|nr:hypothetical protein [Lachnospiraceae bacterium]
MGLTAIDEEDLPLANVGLGAAVASPGLAVGGIISPAAAEMEEDDGLVAVEDEEVPLAVVDLEEDDEENAPLRAVEDEETPLATMDLSGDGAAKHGLWWWSIPVIAAVAGKTGYDKKHRKGIFAEKRETKDNDIG